MRAERARKRQAEVPAYGRKHATTARRPTLSPARAQTGICAHEKESTDAGGRRATHPDDGALLLHIDFMEVCSQP